MEDKTNYELTFLISPELNQQELGDFLKKLESLILKTGQIEKRGEPKKIFLNYLIQKKKEAFFGFFEFKSAPEEIEALKQNLEKEKDILRFLLIKKLIRKQTIKREHIIAPEKPEQPKEKRKTLINKEKVELKEIEQTLKDL